MKINFAPHDKIVCNVKTVLIIFLPRCYLINIEGYVWDIDNVECISFRFIGFLHKRLIVIFSVEHFLSGDKKILYTDLTFYLVQENSFTLILLFNLIQKNSFTLILLFMGSGVQSLPMGSHLCHSPCSDKICNQCKWDYSSLGLNSWVCCASGNVLRLLSSICIRSLLMLADIDYRLYWLEGW